MYSMFLKLVTPQSFEVTPDNYCKIALMESSSLIQDRRVIIIL